jgi:hypothetical protein
MIGVGVKPAVKLIITAGSWLESAVNLHAGSWLESAVIMSFTAGSWLEPAVIIRFTAGF